MTPERLAECKHSIVAIMYRRGDEEGLEIVCEWCRRAADDIIHDLEAQLVAAREAPTKIWNMGHNDDCIFCGLKDSVAAKFVPRPEAWQAENPTATPPSPEVGA